MARDYRAEYQARKARAQSEGFTGYGQQRGYRAKQVESTLTTDPIFGGLPIEQRTRANAILYRKGFLYTGKGTPEQLRARKKFLKTVEGNLDIGVWKDYYKDVIYPALTGKQYPNWSPVVATNMPVTIDEWEEMMRAEIMEEGE